MCDSDNNKPFIVDTSFTRRSVVLTMTSAAAVASLPACAAAAKVTETDVMVPTPGGSAVSCNQVLYNLSRRGIEFDLLPWCRDHGIPIMAYSPIEQARLLAHKTVKRVAGRHNATPAQLCLAWVLRQKGVIAIPKAGSPEHVREDYDALEIELTPGDLHELDEAFPPPREPQPLEMI